MTSMVARTARICRTLRDQGVSDSDLLHDVDSLHAELVAVIEVAATTGAGTCQGLLPYLEAHRDALLARLKHPRDVRIAENDKAALDGAIEPILALRIVFLLLSILDRTSRPAGRLLVELDGDPRRIVASTNLPALDVALRDGARDETARLEDLIATHGGQLRFVSGNARIQVILPTSSAPDRPAGVLPGVLGRVVDEDRVRTLLVDDDRGVRTVLRRQLERSGCRVVETASCEEALAYLKTVDGEIDLLVVDESMPNMSGTQLIAHVMAARPELATLLLSGGDRPPGSELAGEFLQKPVLMANLRAAVDRVIQGTGS